MTKVTSGVKIASEGLAAIPYLASLSTRERTDLARRCRVRAFEKGAIVFSEGQAATGVWVVLGGRVRLARSSPRGREQALHTESVGATLAEVPLFDGGGYVATAVAEDVALRDVTARLSRFLVMEARRAGSDVFDLPGTRDDVAARLGTVRERISR